LGFQRTRDFDCKVRQVGPAYCRFGLDGAPGIIDGSAGEFSQVADSQALVAIAFSPGLQ